MYTKKHNEEFCNWELLTPSGKLLAACYDEETADRLLAHLNRT